METTILFIFILLVLALVICSYNTGYAYMGGIDVDEFTMPGQSMNGGGGMGILTIPPKVSNMPTIPMTAISKVKSTMPPFDKDYMKMRMNVPTTAISNTKPSIPPFVQSAFPTFTNMPTLTATVNAKPSIPPFMNISTPIPTMSSSGLQPTPPSDQSLKYSAINYDVSYHTDSSGTNYESSSDSQSTWIAKDGKLQQIPYYDNSGNHLYYEPGAYRFGPSGYVPTYAESVYLSRLTKESATARYNSTTAARGFCQEYKDYPDKLEEMCRATPTESCGSTSCCALLGGSRCTYGDANGPKIKSIYSDKMIANKDFYYHQGKCYGNCNQTP